MVLIPLLILTLSKKQALKLGVDPLGGAGIEYWPVI